MSEPALLAKNLVVTFADRSGRGTTALSIPFLELPQSGLCAIVGASGCGKSTLLYSLAGLIVPQGARIIWHGQDLATLSPAKRDAWRRRQVGFVFQDFRLIPELSSLDNVLLPLQFETTRIAPDQRTRAQDLLGQFAVPEHRASVSVLSRGEAQRVALARALLRDPPVILADEPTASLDIGSAATVIDALARLGSEGGKLVVCVTHDCDLMARANTIITLDHGKLVS